MAVTSSEILLSSIKYFSTVKAWTYNTVMLDVLGLFAYKNWGLKSLSISTAQVNQWYSKRWGNLHNDMSLAKFTSFDEK